MNLPRPTASRLATGRAGVGRRADDRQPQVVAAPDAFDVTESLGKVEARVQEHHLYGRAHPGGDVNEHAVLERCRQRQSCPEAPHGVGDDLLGGSRLEIRAGNTVNNWA